MSQHVAALERETGLPLVERGTRPTALTDAGHVLVRHGRPSTPGWTRPSRNWPRSPAAGPAGCASAAFRPRSPRSCRPPSPGCARAPAIVLTVVDDHMQGLLPRLTDGDLDLAVVYDHEIAAGGRPAARHVHLFDDTTGPCCRPGTASPGGARR